MARLTSKQVNTLANQFLALAQSIGDYRYTNYDTLTKVQNRKLREAHKRTLDHSDALYTVSATLVMKDVEETLAEIESITLQINSTYKTLENVQKVINIATGVVTLGASIFSLNPQAIITALGKLKNAIVPA